MVIEEGGAWTRVGIGKVRVHVRLSHMSHCLMMIEEGIALREINLSNDAA